MALGMDMAVASMVASDLAVEDSEADTVDMDGVAKNLVSLTRKPQQYTLSNVSQQR
ncbi:hypothetical protein DPMN_012646 [Dreissena polymorpha]|uniref:Uncharacterized protein n=1 Tax=Dreissena polymorpha TaxID=45954 RepID=A0A9D4N2T2_DREPO|nr:hypothetical protein DPMN_012646 [Dreissena polymorpha]